MTVLRWIAKIILTSFVWLTQEKKLGQNASLPGNHHSSYLGKGEVSHKKSYIERYQENWITTCFTLVHAKCDLAILVHLLVDQPF
jgi:hypothetical protein